MISDRTIYRTAIFSIYLYWIGLLIFHTLADFDSSPIWSGIYYMWQQLKDALFVTVIALMIKQMKVFLPIVIYSNIRVCIEIIIFSNGANPNTGWVVNILYFSATAGLCYLTFIQMKKEWLQSKSSSP